MEKFIAEYGDRRDDESKVSEITRQLFKETGFSFEDNHCGNWGIKNGKLIPIDFGQ
jgi:hypothetical protein